MTTNNLLRSAVSLYLIREKDEWENIFDSFKNRISFDNYDRGRRKRASSVKIWFWGLNRWGEDWGNEEYKMREEFNNGRPNTKTM
jgi:hypothetical protein